jgi:hypothetical protein
VALNHQINVSSRVNGCGQNLVAKEWIRAKLDDEWIEKTIEDM